MKILFITPELAPLAKSGGLGDVCEALPKVLVELGVQVDIVIPFYRWIKEKRPTLIKEDIPVSFGWRQLTVDLYQLQLDENIRLFLIARDEFFDRAFIYGTNKGGYFDNGERFAFFSQAVLAAVDALGEKWDIFHCHDWQSALVPVYLKTRYFSHPVISSIKTLLTIHNLGYQGVFPSQIFASLNLPPHLFSIDGLEFWGQVNFLKGGIIFADFLTTVSPTYAKEVQTLEYGFGLDGVLRAYGYKLRGILNGVDYREWNPETDPYIAAHFSKEDLKGKVVCKQDLLQICGLPPDLIQRPLFGMVTRLVEQKGIDLLLPLIERMMQRGIGLIILGTGEKKYEDALTKIASYYPSQMYVKIAFNEVIAHKIIAGADMFLMPSRYEACGLTQLYSLKYGTIPIVRNTGGLADTVEEADLEKGIGTGFKFDDYHPEALWQAIEKAISCFQNKKSVWHNLMQNAMRSDFSWEKSAQAYLEVYKGLTTVASSHIG